MSSIRRPTAGRDVWEDRAARSAVRVILRMPDAATSATATATAVAATLAAALAALAAAATTHVPCGTLFVFSTRSSA